MKVINNLLWFVLGFVCSMLIFDGAAHAAASEEQLKQLEPLSVPCSDVQPLTGVLFLSISRRPFDYADRSELDNLWDRVSKAELRILQLEERICELQHLLDLQAENAAGGGK